MGILATIKNTIFGQICALAAAANGMAFVR
jgi:hypothetical protein